MNTKFFKKNHIVLILFLCVFTLLSQTTFAYAAMGNPVTLGKDPVQSDGLVQPQGVPADEVARLTIFADPSNAPIVSSGGIVINGGTHAWITIKNTGTSNISAGKLTGIAPGKSVSIGTWGNKSENIGIYYNLEAMYYSQGYFRNTNSVSVGLTASDLSQINTKIGTLDSWSNTNNCAAFASNVWNNISIIKLSAGVPTTPSFLSNSIKSKFPSTYVYGASFPYNYSVYYANGSGTPSRSTQY